MSATAKVTVPELATASPLYAAALDKVAKIEAHLVALDARIAATQADLSDLVNNGDAAAQALLDADDLSAAATGGSAALVAERDRLEGDRRTVLRAIDMARLEVRQARGEASAEICKGLAPEYRRRVDRLARALLAAYEAHRDIAALTDDLSEAEIGWAGHLPPVQIPYFLEVGHGDQFPTWLREARTHGLTTVELPGDWVRAWGWAPLGVPAVRAVRGR